MESIYFVISWLCHRTCEHCYEDRFRPYYGEDLTRVVETSVRNVPQIISHLPDSMTYIDHTESTVDGAFVEKRGRVILAGGEVMLEPIREPVLYPALRQLRARYEASGGVELIVQTTGDILREQQIVELRDLDVDVISVSGMDEYHEGFEEEAARAKLREKLEGWFQKHGFAPSSLGGERVGRRYHFFGATPDSWIGRLWPRGRAHSNELSTATLTDNFCNAWSGGLNFLAYRYKGSEVSIDPDGNVYPCCLKTKLPVGNLLEHKLEDVLDRAVGNPVYEAISMGHPERMGIQHGWGVEKFLEKSRKTLRSGRVYQNLCIGCDAFHEEVLMAPELVQIANVAASK